MAFTKSKWNLEYFPSSFYLQMNSFLAVCIDLDVITVRLFTQITRDVINRFLLNMSLQIEIRVHFNRRDSICLHL